MAHILSDRIYYILLGQKGSFDTRLTYVTVSDEDKKGQTYYQLEISDSDGHNSQAVVKSRYPILSPAWSPDQNKIAYVSFINGRSEVFIKYPFERRKSLKLPVFDGIAAAPSWHPDGEKLLLTLSKNNNQDIYQEEKATMETILKDEKYKVLMRFGSSGKNVKVMYLGEQDAIDEVIVYANDDGLFTQTRFGFIGFLQQEPSSIWRDIK